MPLSPVGNPAENITIARPGDASLREPKLARPRFDWGLVDLSKFAQQRFSRMPDSSVTLLVRSFELQPLSTMMSGSRLVHSHEGENKEFDRKTNFQVVWERR